MKSENSPEGEIVISSKILTDPKGEQLVCPVCKSRRIKQDPKWEDNECLNCKRIWN